ncbi:MAG TPA: lipid II flippase MurJ [Acidimicrobiales bacterium]
MSTSATDAPGVTRDAAIGRSTATISFFTLLSRLSGFVRILVVTAILGTTALGDIYETANLVPNLLFELFAAGSVQAVMVPALVQADEREGRAAGESLANAVLGWLLATLGAVVVVAFVGAPLLMRLLTAGEPDAALRSAKASLGSRFLAIFVVQLLFYAVGLVATALLQARRHFVAPAVAPLFNNVVVITAYLIFAGLRHGAAPSLSVSALQTAVLAGGTTLGVAVFTSVPAIAAARRGVRWRPTLRRDPAVARLARQGAWAGAYLGLTQLLTLGVVVLGNGASGTVARFTFAFTFFELPFALLAVPVATARFPAMSSAVVAGDQTRLGQLVGDGVVTTVVGCSAASAALLTLAWPLVRLTAYGHVAGAAVAPLAHTLAAFAPGLVGYGLFYLLTRVRYAQGDVRSPTLANALVAASGLVAMVVGVAMVADSERAAALAAAFGGAHLLGAVVLWVITARSLTIRLTGVARGVVAAIGVAVVAGLVMAFVADRLGSTGRLDALVTLVVSGSAGLLVLGLALPAATGRSPRVLVGAGRA